MNGEKYYTITYSNAYAIQSQKDFYKKFKVLKGYMKVANTATAIKKVTTPAKVYTAAERKVMYHITHNTVSRKSFGKQADTLNKIKAGTKVQRLKEVTADGNKYVFVKINYSKKQLEDGYTPYGWILKDRIKKVK